MLAVTARLLTPIRLGPAELPNRVVCTSHQTSLVHDHVPTDDLVAYHAARAAGGVGAIVIEATAVHPTGLLTPHTLGGYLPGIRAGYERLAGAVRPHGTRLFVQLFHGGREQFGDPPRAAAVAPSAVPSARFASEPRALSGAEIAEIVAGYARAAEYARDGGLDGVEVSMAHGYLPAQFFSPRTNRRTDEWAEDLAFARAVLEAIRGEVGGDLAVGVRLSANELDPDGAGPEESREIVARIAATGLVDYVSLALGHSASYRGSTWIAPPPPAAEDAIVPELPPPGALGDVPVLATTRIVDLDHAERLLESGAAQLVGMARALIAEPELVRKFADGRAPIRCIGCNQACIGHYHLGVPIGCVVNPRTGREARVPAIAARRAARRVLVAGGGPAGIAAALEGARAGDDVTLAERDADVGGQLRLAGAAPAHAETWQRFREMAWRDLEAAGVTVRLETEATAADAAGYDAVVVATGARPHVALAGARSAWEAIRDPGAVTGPVLVADWGGGWDGLDAAEALAAAGHEVTLACAAAAVGATLHQYQRNGYLARLDRLGVRILHHHELAGDPPVLRHSFSGRVSPVGDVGTLVVAHGREPEDALWLALEGRPGCVRVGDVLGPRTLEEAYLEGFLAGRQGTISGVESAPVA
jgi:2,4-dienoyl-CoA reductase-like NADH-dependent reductase (Old Yellow Enzyme family)/thioredoxin reductase